MADAGESVRFRRERPPPSNGTLVFSILVFVAAAVALGWSRGWWMPGPAPAGPVFEIRGDVPRPGLFAVEPPTLRALLAAAGSPLDPTDRPLVAGEVVVVHGEQVVVQLTDDPLLVGLPLDPNTASVAALDAIPGLSTGVAEAIVAERTAHGPFRSLDALRRAPGVSDAVLEALTPFVALSDPGPIDCNTAPASELETLPGVGPALARRMVEERLQGGDFASLEALTRVQGIGPALIERLQGQVRCGAAP